MPNYPAIRFLHRGQQLMRLQGRIAQQMLADIETEQKRFERFRPISETLDVSAFQQEVITNVGKGRERLEDVQLMFQLFYCRQVDNFQIFLEELVRDMTVAEPSILEHVKIKRAEKYTPDERREHRLRQVSRMSLREFRDLLNTSIAFPLVTSTEGAAQLDRLFHVRNLIIHNYGVVDFVFAQQHPEFKLTVGESLEIDRDFIEQSFKHLIGASSDIQLRAQQKFGLWHTGA